MTDIENKLLKRQIVVARTLSENKKNEPLTECR